MTDGPRCAIEDTTSSRPGVTSMNARTTRPARRGMGWFTNLPIAVKIISIITYSACIGVVLCVLAVGRMSALDESQRSMYQDSVVAISDLTAIQGTYESIRAVHNNYWTAMDPQTQSALKAQLTDAHATLDEQAEAY